MPEIKLKTWDPVRETRIINPRDLAREYESASRESPVTFTWNDLGDSVLIISVGADYCIVTMLFDSTFKDLVVSEEETDLVEVIIDGQLSNVPKNTILPREVGLEVLLDVVKSEGDFSELFLDYIWVDE
jgi:hypothetical protein